MSQIFYEETSTVGCALCLPSKENIKKNGVGGWGSKKKNNYTEKKSDKYFLSQVVKVSITSDE